MLFNLVSELNVNGYLLTVATQEKESKRTALMKLIDKINTVHGRHAIHYAIDGVG